MSDPERVAVVTGGGGAGCGRAIARRFAVDGFAVVVSDIDATGGAETVARIHADGGRAAFHHADVRDDAQARALIAASERTYGRVSVLVNNASAPEPPVEGLSGWLPAIETDLLGALFASRWAIESMTKTGGGAIVNIASITALWRGRTSPGGFPGYDVAKAGVVAMTTGLADLATREGIRVNCLAPGWIATGGALAYWQSLTPEERAARGVPARLLDPAGVAGMVFRLATDRALSGRVVVWWSEKDPRLVAWADRGYCEYADLPPA